MPKRHLQKVANAKDCLLQLAGFHLALLLSLLLVVERRSFWFLQRIVGESFDDTYHFGDWVNDELLRVIGEHDGTSGEDDAREDRRHELEHRLAFLDRLDTQPHVRDQFVTAIVSTVEARPRSVRQELEFFRS